MTRTQVTNKPVIKHMPKIRLKKILGDGTRQSIVSRRKMKILSIIVREPASEWTLEVIYGPDIYNSGTFFSKEDAQSALSAWTSQDQMKFVHEGRWD